VSQIDRTEGRRLFGADPAAYDRARPGHPDRVYDVLVARCGLELRTAVLEIGPGTAQATRRLLELGADPLVVVEPDLALAAHLADAFGAGIEIRVVALEGAALSKDSFDLAVAASSFHWVEEALGLEKLFEALRPDGWFAMWWTLFGDGEEPDAFITATSPLLEDLQASPSRGGEGRPAFALDSEARSRALRTAGFEDLEHEVVRWATSWDTEGIRALYGTFSPIARLDEPHKKEILDGIARIAAREFGGRVERTLTTSLYSARRPG